jgi:hypothetical protein
LIHLIGAVEPIIDLIRTREPVINE